MRIKISWLIWVMVFSLFVVFTVISLMPQTKLPMPDVYLAIIAGGGIVFIGSLLAILPRLKHLSNI